MGKHIARNSVRLRVLHSILEGMLSCQPKLDQGVARKCVVKRYKTKIISTHAKKRNQSTEDGHFFKKSKYGHLLSAHSISESIVIFLIVFKRKSIWCRKEISMDKHIMRTYTWYKHWAGVKTWARGNCKRHFKTSCRCSKRQRRQTPKRYLPMIYTLCQKQHNLDIPSE